VLFCQIASQVRGQAISDSSARSTTPKKDILWIIPQTHWEGAVFKTKEEYLEIGLPHILQAMNLLKLDPEYRFVLDQVSYVKPFLDSYPEEVANFQKYIEEGRLQIVGGMDVMPDVNIPSGESWIRQVSFGKGYYRDRLGVDVKSGWALDTFGHHAQMPQLLKSAGFESYWLERGVKDSSVPSEFVWQGLDGSKIPVFFPHESQFTDVPKNLIEFDVFARNVYAARKLSSLNANLSSLAGADVSEPEPDLPKLVQEFNKKNNAPFSLRFAVPAEFEAATARGNLPVVRGELNPVFQGVYSSRIDLKQWMRSDERVLTDAESLSALALTLGVGAAKQDLKQAWEPVLFNQAHDLSSGTIVDKVYQEAIRGYRLAQEIGEASIGNSLDTIGSRIDTRGEGIPIAVFNTLGWPRTDCVEAEFGFSDSGLSNLVLVDPSGHSTPIQFVETLRHPDGGIRHVKLEFVARDVPAFGYSVYRLVSKPAEAAANIPSPSEASHDQPMTTRLNDHASIENEYYRASFDLWTGELTDLRVKAGDWAALKGPANVVTREQDGGDLWELEGTLNGGRYVGMTRLQPLPRPDRSQLSSEFVGGNGETTTGPVFSEFQISHPFENGSFATRVRLYRGIPRVNIRTKIVNNDKMVRYRVLFPTAISNGKRVDEIPFGAVERPQAKEFPAQNWSDYSDGDRGVALLNRGLPGNNVAENTLVLSLLRSARISAYPFHGGYEPGVSSDLGFELGEEHTFDYALVPHAGDWKGAAIYRSGMEFNRPLIPRKLALHAGALPNRWGWLEVSAGNVVTSALKPGSDNSLIVRVYEASGQSSPGMKIKMASPVASAFESDVIEREGTGIAVRGNTLQFDLAPFQIKTFKLRLQP
jgi:alpha-mannosidase